MRVSRPVAVKDARVGMRVALVPPPAGRRKPGTQPFRGLVRGMEGGAVRVAWAEESLKGAEQLVPATWWDDPRALTSGEVLLTGDDQKAEHFARMYAEVSAMSEQDRKEHAKLSKRVETELQRRNRAAPPGGLCAPFTLPELRGVLRNLKQRKAGGVDEVANEMLRQLSPEGEGRLLELVNASWAAGEVPEAWRVAEIVPIPKAGKDPTDPASWRPISLTSCVAKVAERLVQGRVQHLLESRGLLRPEQAGFRRARSCEEHIVRMAQTIEDGLAQGQLSLVLLVDFARYFDGLNRNKLCLKLLRMGVPPQAVRWFRSYLSGRQARVRCGGAVSEYHEFEAGTPQGGVCGPMLATVYLNDIVQALARGLPAGCSLEVFLYADDLALVVRGKTVKALRAAAQRLLDNLRAYAEENSLTVSTDKTEFCVVGEEPLDPAERPALRYGAHAVKYNPTPKFLGVLFDETLSFAAHVEKTAREVRRRGALVARLSGATWGANTKTLRILHQSYVQSVLDYGLAGYGSFGAYLQPLDHAQYQAACKVSGCTRDTRATVALREAELYSATQRAERAAALAYERCRRLPADNPARLCAEAEVASTEGRTSWRETARRVVREAELDGCAREPILTHAGTPPWAAGADVTFRPDLLTAVRKAPKPTRQQGMTATHRYNDHECTCQVCAEHKERLRAATRETLAALPPAHVEAWTDGSVLDSRRSRQGGGGYVLKDATGETHRGVCAAGRFCNSFRAEAAALRLCLRDILQKPDIAVPRRAEIRLCTDSRSVIEALSRGPSAQTGRLEEEVWQLLEQVAAKWDARLTLQWVPGHVDLAEQEESDEVAKRAARDCAQEDAPLSYGVAKAVIDGALRARWHASTDAKPYVGIPADHVWRRATGSERVPHRGHTPRGEQRLLAQLHAGKAPVLEKYLKQLKKLETPQCRDCGADGADDGPDGDVEHVLLRCPAHRLPRERHLGPDATLRVLTEKPDSVIRYMRAIGRDGIAGASYKTAARAAAVAAAAVCLVPATVHAQSSTEFVSVTDAMLQRPAPEDC